MTLTIIAGTHTFVDLTGKFRTAWSRARQKRVIYDIDGVKFAKHRFDRVEITEDGEVVYFPSRIFPMDRNGFAWSVSQPTGSGKTVLAVYHLAKTYFHGGNIQANFSYQYFKHNIGLPKDKWTPSINSVEDLIEAKKCRLVVDDIKGTIERWQAKEADIITMVANLGRKDGVDLDFTTQRVINYVPPNIRAVATGYEIPYITIRDCRVPSPDNKGFPVEMEVMSLLPADAGDVFVGFGVLNKDIPDERVVRPTQALLDSYKTMELAVGLKVGKDGARPNQPGYALEVKAFEFLKANVPGMQWKHLNGKDPFDIISSTHAIDVCDVDDGGRLITDHKGDWNKHIRNARRKGQAPYLMFEFGGDFGFIRIKDTLPKDSRMPIDYVYNRIRRLNSVFFTEPN